MPRTEYAAILRELVDKQVDFIVVGGVCAVLHGAPVTSFGLDILHSTEEANIARLKAAMESLPNCAPLDLQGSVGNGHTYRELIHQTTALEVAEHLTVPVLDLASLIALKEETDGEKDRAMLPILRRTLEEKEKISNQ